MSGVWIVGEEGVVSLVKIVSTDDINAEICFENGNIDCLPLGDLHKTEEEARRVAASRGKEQCRGGD